MRASNAQGRVDHYADLIVAVKKPARGGFFGDQSESGFFARQLTGLGIKARREPAPLYVGLTPFIDRLADATPQP